MAVHVLFVFERISLLFNELQKSFMSPIFSGIYTFFHVLLHYENKSILYIRKLSCDALPTKTLAVQFTSENVLRNVGFTQTSTIKKHIWPFHRRFNLNIRQWQCYSVNVCFVFTNILECFTKTRKQIRQKNVKES